MLSPARSSHRLRIGHSGVALFALLSALAPPVRGAAEVSSEYQLKAVLLWRLTQFVEWPAPAFATPTSPIVIGVLGENPFGPGLEIAVRGQVVWGRKLAVQYYRTAGDVRPCHVLYISRSESGRVRNFLTRWSQWSVLTVSDIDGFARLGGVVGFVTEDKRVSFRINLDAAKAAGLVISSKLLRMVQIAGGGE